MRVSDAEYEYRYRWECWVTSRTTGTNAGLSAMNDNTLWIRKKTSTSDCRMRAWRDYAVGQGGALHTTDEDGTVREWNYAELFR